MMKREIEDFVRNKTLKKKKGKTTTFLVLWEPKEKHKRKLFLFLLKAIKVNRMYVICFVWKCLECLFMIIYHTSNLQQQKNLHKNFLY